MKIRYVIVVALLAFLAGAAVSAALLTSALVKQEMMRGTTASVFVAREPMKPGAIDPNAFRVVDMAKLDCPPNAVLASHALDGRRLRRELKPGEVLAEEHLEKREASSNKHVVNVPLTADKAVGFFVVPGSRVDVTQNRNGKSTVLLKNVLVLAVDLITVAPEDRAGLPGGTATLLVDSAEDAVKLAEATKSQPVSLIILPPADAADGEKPAPQPVPPPPPVFEDK
jgi:Flp pilus assembly protein CpaB